MYCIKRISYGQKNQSVELLAGTAGQKKLKIKELQEDSDDS
jgi:hypothetical protein